MGLRLPALAVSLVLTLALPSQSASNKELERELKAGYEGQLIRLLSPAPIAGFQLQISAEEAQSIGWGAPVCFLVERVKLKKNKLELRAQRIYLYQDAEDHVREAPGHKATLQLKWEGARPDGAELQHALGQAFKRLDTAHADLADYWPPMRPQTRPAQPPGSAEQLKLAVKERGLERDQPARPPAIPPVPRPAEELAPGVFTLGTGVSSPECVSCPNPLYTEEARWAKVSGIVALAGLMNDNGRILGLRLLKSLGHGLDESAVKTVYGWHFKSAVRDGKPVRVVFMLEVNFRVY